MSTLICSRLNVLRSLARCQQKHWVCGRAIWNIALGPGLANGSIACAFWCSCIHNRVHRWVYKVSWTGLGVLAGNASAASGYDTCIDQPRAGETVRGARRLVHVYSIRVITDIQLPNKQRIFHFPVCTPISKSFLHSNHVPRTHHANPTGVLEMHQSICRGSLV